MPTGPRRPGESARHVFDRHTKAESARRSREGRQAAEVAPLEAALGPLYDDVGDLRREVAQLRVEIALVGKLLRVGLDELSQRFDAALGPMPKDRLPQRRRGSPQWRTDGERS